MTLVEDKNKLAFNECYSILPMVGTNKFARLRNMILRLIRSIIDPSLRVKDDSMISKSISN